MVMIEVEVMAVVSGKVGAGVRVVARVAVIKGARVGVVSGFGCQE